MEQPILKVSSVSKKYEIISNKENKDTFTAVLIDSIKSTFNNKKKEKDEFWALKNINFTVNKGERVGIIGHNGAGKSTLLKVFSRITIPTEGEIEVRGRIASLLEVGTGFHMELTGRENIYLNGSILGMSKEEIDEKFNDIVEFSEVRGFLDVPVKKYSSGMFVKLAFAVASHLDPDILIVDEVLAVGDMKFQEKCLGKMEDVASGGRTVLYVSHSMRTIQQLCTRVIVMNQGKIIHDGNVDEGIKIYMDNTKEMSNINNLEVLERPEDINRDITMKQIELIDSTNCCYRSDEILKLALIWQSNKEVEEVFVRIVISFSDMTPAGVTLSKSTLSARKNELCKSILEFNLKNLAPGKYITDIILYKINEFGTEERVDIAPVAFAFEVIIDENKTNKLEWRHRYWGHTQYDDLRILN